VQDFSVEEEPIEDIIREIFERETPVTATTVSPVPKG
jgi:hypothetical protein